MQQFLQKILFFSLIPALTLANGDQIISQVVVHHENPNVVHKQKKQPHLKKNSLPETSKTKPRQDLLNKPQKEENHTVLISVGGQPFSHSARQNNLLLLPNSDNDSSATGVLSAELSIGDSRVKASPQGISDSNSLAYTKQPYLVPPTVTAQLNFAPEEKVRPYLGLGLNYTGMSQNETSSLNIENKTAYQQDVFGSALQFGADVDLTDRLYLNFDAKRLNMRSGSTDVKHDINQWVYGVGLGVKF